MPGLRPTTRAVVGSVVRSLAERVARVAAIGPADRAARSYGRFGTGSIVAWPTGAGFGERWIWLGSDTLIAAHVTLSAGMGPGQQMVTDPVVRIGDRMLAVADTCTHAEVFLSDGDVDVEDRTIECWKHGSLFSLETGEALTLPATQPVEVFAVRTDGDDIVMEER